MECPKFAIIITCFFTIFSCKQNVKDKEFASETVSNRTNKINYEKEFSRFKGFFSEVEYEPIEIDKNKIPGSLKKVRNQNISKITLRYLTKLENGYLVNFGLFYETQKFLLTGTLNNNYDLIDHRIFPDGTIGKFIKSDTISFPVFDDEKITIELMHPNEFEEPEFEVDGIQKHILKINKDLIFEEM